MKCIGDLYTGDEIQVETGYTNWNRADNEFYCVVEGWDKEGRVILNAKNAVCFDGRNKIQPYFVVNPKTGIEDNGLYKKIPGCYVIWDIIGMTPKGQFILKTELVDGEAE